MHQTKRRKVIPTMKKPGVKNNHYPKMDSSKTTDSCIRRFVQHLKGTWLLFVMFWSSILAVVIFHSVLMPLQFFPVTHKLYRKMADALVYSWLIFDVAMLELLMGMKVVLSGDVMCGRERSLIIMNHRTRLDWMFFWSALVRQSGVATEKIILKSMLKKIPGAGWAMQVGMFMFIDRKWEQDKVTLSKLIDYYSQINHNTQVLLFPEGTDFTPRTKAKSDEFAKKNGVAPYEYLLHPRTTGFTYLAQYMRQASHLDAVYDVTVGYPVNIPQNEADMAKGNFPKEVNFHIKRYAVQSLPAGESGLQDWCKTRWNEKEQRLKTFYEQRTFSHDESKPGVDGDTETSHNQQLDVINSERFERDRRGRRILLLALFYWTAFVVAIIVLLFYSSVVRYYSLFQVCFFIFMGHKYGGFEMFQIDYFNRFFNSKRLQRSDMKNKQS